MSEAREINWEKLGTIECHRINGWKVSSLWIGPPKIAMSKELIELEYGSASIGSVIWVGQYRVRLIDFYPDRYMYIAERVKTPALLGKLNMLIFNSSNLLWKWKYVIAQQLPCWRRSGR